MKISNFAELATTELRKDALQIAEAGFMAIDSGNTVRRALKLEGDTLTVGERSYNIASEGKLIVIGVGKCAIEAAKATEEILGERITGGLVLDTRENNICEFIKIECFKGTHPMPSEQNVAATKRIIELLRDLKEDHIVLFLISGGGSTLLCLPEEGYNCLDEELIVAELFRAGADIGEINTIRKHMSLARGGYLSKHAYPARTVSVIFSDVPGNDLSTIASGPTVKDTSTVADADKVLEKYGILRTCGIEHCGLIETPKEDKYFANTYNYLAISNEQALEAMANEAHKLGYESVIIDSQISGEAALVGKKIAEQISKAKPKSAQLYGGETTVTIHGNGRGGRNQQLVLASLHEIKESSLVMSFASDGRDNGPYAGAIVDWEILSKAKAMNLEPEKFLNENNSSVFFEEAGGLLKTGETGSNVSDLIIALSK